MLETSGRQVSVSGQWRALLWRLVSERSRHCRPSQWHRQVFPLAEIWSRFHTLSENNQSYNETTSKRRNGRETWAALPDDREVPPATSPSKRSTSFRPTPLTKKSRVIPRNNAQKPRKTVAKILPTQLPHSTTLGKRAAKQESYTSPSF